ncbi:PREDICTED: LOW QUALITY PROTEIN: protein bride of sevenless [Trachymyrmex cornetzi]|uniref:LOW QUALITY PROTEIN: protein bride of sevenless n=1 Tax=Trachymyrmex cornetzi TaxID=471704 RepID=UPI00084F0F48|nr:PREDICTED: LOW QUALITY PROTEIN: protein bride of sevenless [Trachymyrmex cornetzi]
MEVGCPMEIYLISNMEIKSGGAMVVGWMSSRDPPDFLRVNKISWNHGDTGLRIFDTCHDRIIVFRQVLRVVVEQSCAPDYEMGILMLSQYGPMMEYLLSYNGLPIGIYEERDFTVPIINILAHYLSTKYKIVDLVHANTDSVLDDFLEVIKDAGVCVKRSDRHVNGDRYANVTEMVIVAIDLIPSESYVIKPEISRFDLGEFSSAGEFLENCNNLANHSPYLLDVEKAVIKLAEVFQDFRKRNCSIDEESSIMTQSPTLESQTLESQREIRDFDVYKHLHMQPESHLLKYVVITKIQHEFIDVALYEIEMPKLRVLPKRTIFEMPGICLEHLIKNCENCTNFQSRDTKVDVVGKNVLKNSFYVPVFLIVIICGILVCCIMMIFCLYHITTKEILHGNLVFTIVLVLVNLFILLTALPFCVTDDYFGTENLNAWKILLTTLASARFGLIFSIMLSRALFLTLSTGGVFIHINGYLQSLMALLAYGVQIAMSVMYFVLSTTNSAVVIRSLIFIALLGYDIFLLIALFVTCYFIIQIQHNYHEEKYFFRTSIGLLIIWVIVWLTCFMLMQSENRDAVIFFGTVATAYLIIFGVLISRIYYIMRTPKRKNLGQRFDPVNLLTDSTVNTIIRQSCSSHDYVYPARESQILRMPSAYSNYYGNLSSNSKYFKRCRSPNHYEMPTYNNYECYAKMKEIDAAYVTLRMYVENTEFLATNNVIYAKPKIYKFQRISLEERSNTETTCNRDNSSPVSRQHIEMYSIRYTSPTNILRERKIDEEEENEEEEEEDEKDQEDEGASRITRF